MTLTLGPYEIVGPLGVTGRPLVFVTGVAGRDWKEVDVKLDCASGLSKLAPASGKR